MSHLHEKKIGVLGGGQLGRMLAQSAVPYAVDLHFLDQEADFPAAQVSGNFHKGSFKSYDDVLAFGEQMDVLTIEIENVNVEALKELEAKGKQVYPQPAIIETIKDKGLQKMFYRSGGFNTSEFILVESKEDLLTRIAAGEVQYPFVQKSRTAGYDGKGVSIIKSADDRNRIMDTPSVIEHLVDIEKELAITIVRNADGDMVHFPVVEMVFNPAGNLLDYLLSPAEVSDEIAEKCKEIGYKLVTELGLVGILAIELFLTKEGEIIINEIAPRTHNSGHHTINASNHSQFEMHLRSILNLPLNDIKQAHFAIMLNLLGEEGFKGKPYYEGFKEVMAMENVYVHLYGKTMTKPLRKMGHVTIVEKELEYALQKLSRVKSTLKVKS